MYAIEVYNLVKEYDGIRAVDDVTFKVDEGSIFSLLGPNGAGKTTIVEMLIGLRDPTYGDIKILGHRPDDREVKYMIGFMPQDFRVFEKLTVRENLELFAMMYDKHRDVGDLINDLNMREYADVRFERLSGGLKQRLGLAIALVNDPKLIFLDEPTTGLDPASRRHVWDIIDKLRDEGKTILLTSHYMDEVEYLADRVAVIDRGKIVAEGYTREIIDRFGGSRRLVVKDGYMIVDEIKSFTDSIRIDGRDLIVYIDHADIRSIIDHLFSRGYGFYFRNPSLEDAFLRLVGEMDEYGSVTKR
jgi:ABC-2 type transport system ATP-binding protein